MKDGERAYLTCASKGRTNCPARLQKTRTFSFGRQILIHTVKGEHNHDPPAKTPLSNEAHRRARELCKIIPAGRAHEQITRELREQGEESTAANTPTRTQLHHKRVYQNRRHFPTSDAIQNINLMHGPTGFLQENSSYPVVRIILASQAGLKLLRQHGTALYIDTTFKLIEQDLKLTVTL